MLQGLERVGGVNGNKLLHILMARHAACPIFCLTLQLKNNVVDDHICAEAAQRTPGLLLQTAGPRVSSCFIPTF